MLVAHISPSPVALPGLSSGLPPAPRCVPSATPPPKLLDRVRHALQTGHDSRRTEKAYVGWIRRYILFHGKQHPTEMGAKEVTQFLTSLAVDRQAAASTQNQALGALAPDGAGTFLALQKTLWRVPGGGGEATRLTEWNVEATRPVFSPEGPASRSRASPAATTS
jgi:hypothetical protein